jgi:hypothetical protein
MIATKMCFSRLMQQVELASYNYIVGDGKWEDLVCLYTHIPSVARPRYFRVL